MVYKFRLPTTSIKHQRLSDLRGSLISAAGLVGRSIINQEGQELASVVELVCHWDSKETYPPLTGIIAKVAWRKVWIPYSNIKHINQTLVTLNNAKLDLRDFKAREGEVRLNKEVLDHQLIDVDGARVVRASDLYLALINNSIRLVGVDVGYKPLLRRLGPSNFRKKATPNSVIDWATIESFGSQEGSINQLRLSSNRQELRRMRPGELADMLEDLGREERQELLNALTPELAADALEEMNPKELEGLLRESSLEEGASYLSEMEPDEAADALRDVDHKLRQDLLALMDKDNAAQVKKVLAYDEETAGGIMNTMMLLAKSSEKVVEVVKRLNDSPLDLGIINSLAITDKEGKLLYDLPLANLLTADDKQTLAELMKPPASVTVEPEASLKEVAKLLVESRSTSIVVVDKNEHPLGRIMADDLLDVLLPNERFHFPRLLSS
jgi:flagellar motility protein MotE (MotC chaperone)/sporulation protein YlmC with PRC-barrel domain